MDEASNNFLYYSMYTFNQNSGSYDLYREETFTDSPMYYIYYVRDIEFVAENNSAEFIVAQSEPFTEPTDLVIIHRRSGSDIRLFRFE